MKKIIKLLVIVVFIIILLLTACNSTDKSNSNLKVIVSIAPQKFLLERIAGSSIDIEVLIGAGDSPATYDLTPKQMSSLSNAALFFPMNLPFEKNLMIKIREQRSDLMIADTYRGISLRTFTTNHDTHQHESFDPHFWLDPKLAAIHAQTMYESLVEFLPKKKKNLQQNLVALKNDLFDLDSILVKRFAAFRDYKLWVFHPTYGYFTDAYGLHQQAIEIEGKEPSANQLAKLIELAREDNVSALFVQPQFSKKLAETLAAEINCQVIELDPLAEDYISNLKTMADKIMTVFKQADSNLVEEAG